MLKKHHLYLLLLSVIFLIATGTKAFASEMNFSVQAVIPENQVDKSQSYFDLRMKPGESQDLVVEMQNDTDKAVTVNVLPNTAITNQNGIVQYDDTKTPQDSTLKTSFKSIATSDKEVTIPAKSKKDLKVHVQMPSAEYDGVILGGLYFSEKTAEEPTKATKGSQVTNQYAYVIGVKLTENDNVVNPDLKLTSVGPKQVNYRNVIAANIQNYTPTIIKDLSIEGNVYSKGGKDVLYTTSRNNLRMAPNSNFDFAVSLNNTVFKPGKYTFKGTAKSGDKVWKFEKDFEIKGATAKKYNKKAVSLKKEPTQPWWYLGIGIVLFLILIIIILILMRKLKKAKTYQTLDENEEDDEN